MGRSSTKRFTLSPDTQSFNATQHDYDAIRISSVSEEEVDSFRDVGRDDWRWTLLDDWDGPRLYWHVVSWQLSFSANESSLRSDFRDWQQCVQPKCRCIQTPSVVVFRVNRSWSVNHGRIAKSKLRC